jgi:Mce-associated membrane protein
VTPSWYDVLDVDPTASTEEVRAAWRGAVADLDPTDRRFRLLNQAAEVLLDPVRRADHDAALAADAEPEAGPATDLRSSSSPSASEGVVETPAADVDKGPVAEPTADPTEEPGAADEPVLAGSSRGWWQPPVWLVVALAVLAAAVATAAFLTFRSPSDSTVASDTETAQNAAERAAEAVLAYDYRNLDASEAAASAYLTPSFRQDYDQLFTLIKDNADTVKPVVTVQVLASGIERVSADGDRVSVLVFVNRPTTNAETSTPRVSQDQVTMQMQKVDGDWLVDDMVSTPAAAD